MRGCVRDGLVPQRGGNRDRVGHSEDGVLWGVVGACMASEVVVWAGLRSSEW